MRGVPAWGAALLSLAAAAGAVAQEVCYECHGDPELRKRRGGEIVSLFVDAAAFGQSVHGTLECNDCHMDVDQDDLPHP